MREKILAVSRQFYTRFSKDQITVYTAQAAYFVVMSMAPFLMVLVAVVLFLIPDQLQTVIDTVVLLMPGELGTQAEELLTHLFRSPSVSAFSLSLLLSLWSASRGIMGLQQGLHVIYHVTEKGNYFVQRFRSILYTFVFIAAIILALALLVLGQTIEGILRGYFPFLGSVFQIFLFFRIPLAVAVFIVAFAFAYRYLTGMKCRFTEALPGVLISTIGWILFSSLFSIYMTYFSNYTFLYGSLGIILLLCLWIYACILILMVGAEINRLIGERRGIFPD